MFQNLQLKFCCSINRLALEARDVFYISENGILTFYRVHMSIILVNSCVTPSSAGHTNILPMVVIVNYFLATRTKISHSFHIYESFENCT